MVNFTAQELRRTMNKKHNIRIICVIDHQHQGNGKSAVIDSLVLAAGIITQEGDVPTTDSQAAEAEDGITVKSIGTSLFYVVSDESLQSERDGNELLINIIGTPGHADFFPDLSAVFCITDGALVVADCVEGVCSQTEVVIRQALNERIKPVLILNMIEKCFFDSESDGEKIYQAFSHVIKDTNEIIAAHDDKFQVYPEKGMVAFSAGIHGWTFTLTSFAKMASSNKNGESKMMVRLWGDHFFNPESKKWSTMKKTDSPWTRGFIYFCYRPIKKIIDFCMNDQKDELWLRLARFGVTMKDDDKELMGEDLAMRVLQTWLPTSPPLLGMIVGQLPSPWKAQQYRTDRLYKGPIDDMYATAIRNCESKGPLMMYVSKMIPASSKDRCFAFGRVFAGTVAAGMKVRIMGPDYMLGQEKDLHMNKVQRAVIWTGKQHQFVEDIPCGNTVAILGLDQTIIKSGTVTGVDEVGACPLRAMMFSAPHVVRVDVCCDTKHNLALLAGLEHLTKSDPFIAFTVKESSGCIVAGVGELHVQTCLNDLKELMGSKITIGPLDVLFREAVTSKSSITCQFVNKYNRLHMRACSLDEKLLHAITDGRIDPLGDSEARSNILSQEFGWDKDASHKIWCFGSEATGMNMLVNMCKGQENEIIDSIVAGIRLACENGALAGENMHGICFELCDINLHADHKCRGNDQIIQKAAKRAAHASQLAAEPRLLEPIYLVEIEAQRSVLNAVNGALNLRRGNLFEAREMPCDSLYYYKVKAYMAVKDSFEFSSLLKHATSNKAIITRLIVSHWEVLNSHPLRKGSMAAKHVTDVRKMKGIRSQIPCLSELLKEL